MTLKEEKLAWIQKKRKLRQRYVFLLEKDLKFDEGQQDAMLLKIGKRLGKTKEELKQIMDAL
jgi:hypothetical protein